MSTGGILLLGAIAGFTIFLGLPVGRMRSLTPQVRTLLNAVAIGVLVFLLVDVFEHAVTPVEQAVSDSHWASLAGLGSLLAVGFGVGLLSLVYYDRLLPRRRSVGGAKIDGASSSGTSVGPGAAAVQEFAERRGGLQLAATPARKLALMIAVGIGLHNFAEGLAIGQSAAADEISLAVLLVVGFGLHNATEGFGIVGPLAGDAQRPSWGLLAAYGLIGGGPTFLGTLLGQSFTSDAVSVLFLSLAAGSILYVVVQLVGVALRSGFKEMLYWGLFLGVIAGIATELVITAAGA